MENTAKFQITVELVPNYQHQIGKINLSDMDLTPSEWEKMNKEQRNEAVQNYVDENFDQPYWHVEKIN